MIPAASWIERAGICAIKAPVLLQDGGFLIFRHLAGMEY